MSTRKFLNFFFIIMLLAIYNVPIGALNFSLDRLLIPIAFVALLVNNRTKVPGLGLLIFWLITSSILSIVFADNYDLRGFMSFGPSWFQSIVVFYLAVASANKFGVDLLDKVFKWHLYILIPLTLYGFWFVYVKGVINFKYPLDFLLGDINSQIHKVKMLRNNRLFFPLSSAPRLGFVAGCLFIYFLYFIKSRRSKWWYCGSSLFIMLVTISRGPIVSLVLSFVLAYFLKGALKKTIKNQIVVYFFMMIIGLFVILNVEAFFELENSPFKRIFLLGSEQDASFQGHLNIRLEVLKKVFSGTVTHLFFGYGLGQFLVITGTTSAHSSYFTQLYEQGIFGVLGYLLVFITTVGTSMRLYLKYPSKHTMSFLVMAIFLGVIHLTYDAITTTILWAYTGFVYGASLYLKRVYEA